MENDLPFFPNRSHLILSESDLTESERRADLLLEERGKIAEILRRKDIEKQKFMAGFMETYWTVFVVDAIATAWFAYSLWPSLDIATVSLRSILELSHQSLVLTPSGHGGVVGSSAITTVVIV